MEFVYYAPLRIAFCRGCSSKIASYTSRNGNRVLLVTGRKHLKETGALDKILNSFKNSRKIEKVILFNKARENPNIELIDEASEIIIKNRLNVVAAVGGGSSMDLSKAAGIAAKQQKSISDIMQSGDINIMKAYPVICMPTTSGSGSEVTKYAVINNDKQKIKTAISSESIYPAATIIDPQLTYTMNKQTIANTGFDALSHAIEAYTSKSSSPITDAYCRQAVSLISANIKDAYYYKDKKAMDNMSLAAMLAGLALNVGRASLPHAMEHSLSAYNSALAHGMGLSMVMLPFVKRAFRCAPERFADIAYLLGKNISNMELEEAAEQSVYALDQLKNSIGLNNKLSDFGFNQSVIKDMVENTFWTMAHGIENSPCSFTKDDILNMYLEVL